MIGQGSLTRSQWSDRREGWHAHTHALAQTHTRAHTHTQTEETFTAGLDKRQVERVGLFFSGPVQFRAES